VSLYVYDAMASSLSVVRCTNQTKALMILKGVAASSTKMTSISCSSSTATHMWQSAICAGCKIAMCIDCADPCGTEQCPRLLQLNPCGVPGNAYGCAGQNGSVNAYRVFTAEYEPFSVPPTFQSIAIVPAKRSIVTTVGLQSVTKKSVNGTVYCGVFAAGVVPTSITAIVVQNQAAVSVLGVAAITVNNLIPATSYDVYLVAVSPLGATMALADVLASKQNIRTLCCRSVKVSMTIQTLYQGASAVNSVVVTLDAPPAVDLTISLRTQSASASTTSALVPVKISLTSATRIMSYTNSIASDSSSILGLTSLIATLSGTSAVDYVVVYAQRSNFTVISLDTITLKASGGDVMQVQAFLNTKYTISPPLPVPSGYFPEGVANIVITLCNFLGLCGQGSMTLTVTDR
jgi:hypothetical protein